ncbi:ABC transporter permease [Fretibacterium sp. OH1220_COT-178]|nr:ABC transporter permease [Fretibacterium sp. OH1220_COT-178]
MSPYFLKLQNLVNIVRQVSYTGIIGLGMTFVIISAGIDLSVGSVLAFTGAVVILTMNALLPMLQSEVLVLALGIIAGVSVGACAGAFNGLMITRGRIAPFIVTLGTMAIFRSLTLYIGDAGEIQSRNALYGSFGMGSVLGIPVPVIVFLGIALVLHLVLNNTRYGRYLCAVGSNQRVALFSAIDVDRIRFYAYTLTGALVGVSAVLLGSRFNAVSTSNMGLAFELDAIAAVIIGGTAMSGGRGTIWGTVWGGLILGIINNMMNMVGVSPYLQGTVKGLVIIVAVYVQRQKQ